MSCSPVLIPPPWYKIQLDGLTMERKTVALQTGVEDNIFEDEWHPQRNRETNSGQEDLVIRYNDFVFSDSVPGEQHKFQETGLRLKDQSLRLVESTMASRPSGATDFWTNNGGVWDQTSCPSSTQLPDANGGRRSATRSGTSPVQDDSCRPFAGQCGQRGLRHLDGGHRLPTAQRSYCFGGPPLPISSEPSGQTHKATPLPSPPDHSKAEIEAHNLTHLPYR